MQHSCYPKNPYKRFLITWPVRSSQPEWTGVPVGGRPRPRPSGSGATLRTRSRSGLSWQPTGSMPTRRAHGNP